MSAAVHDFRDAALGPFRRGGLRALIHISPIRMDQARPVVHICDR